MSIKSWQHVSPVTGLGPCSAQSPGACKYKNAKHFDDAAADRIKTGQPRNFNEHEAMMLHREILARRNMEEGVSTPKPKPAPAKPQPVTRPFPTQHRASQKPSRNSGNEVLYHMELGFPTGFQKPSGRKELEYSHHALNATLDDKYGRIPILQHINLDRLQLVELGVADERVSKMVYRGHLDSERDMCIVVIPKPGNQKMVCENCMD